MEYSTNLNGATSVPFQADLDPASRANPFQTLVFEPAEFIQHLASQVR